MNTAGQQLAALYLQNFGYLSAADIAMWIDPQTIISAQNRNPKCCVTAVKTAISLVSSKLMNLYDLRSEFLKSDTVPASGIIATLNAGALATTKIIGVGTNYIAAPNVQVVNASGDPGINGVVTALVGNTVVESIDLIENGCRYQQPPTISFTPVDGNGAGAAATCVIDKWGRVTKITLTNGGSGWTAPPVVVFTSSPVLNQGGGAIAVANLQYGSVTALNITTAGSGYAVAPTLVISGGQVADTRNEKLVMITAINAVRVLLGNGANVGEKTQADFKMADQMIFEILSGTGALPLLSANRKLRSVSTLVRDNFRMLG